MIAFTSTWHQLRVPVHRRAFHPAAQPESSRHRRIGLPLATGAGSPAHRPEVTVSNETTQGPGSHADSRWITLCHFRCYGSQRSLSRARRFAVRGCAVQIRGGSAIFDPLTGRLPWLCWFDECPGRTPGYMVGARLWRGPFHDGLALLLALMGQKCIRKNVITSRDGRI